MKKMILPSVIAVFLIACNRNPSATGDAIIMEHEKKTNALEWQNGPSDSISQSTPVKPDSLTSTDSVQNK